MKALLPPKKLGKRQDNNATMNLSENRPESFRKRIRNPNDRKTKHRKLLRIIARENQKKKREKNSRKEANIEKKPLSGKARQGKTGENSSKREDEFQAITWGKQKIPQGEKG